MGCQFSLPMVFRFSASRTEALLEYKQKKVHAN